MYVGAYRSLLRSPAVVAAASTTTWNPSDKHADITLSNGDLTATHTGASDAFRSVRSIASNAAGKVYFEITAGTVTAGSVLFGIGNATESLATYPGGTLNSCALMTTGVCYLNGANIGTATAFSSGSVVSVAFDASAERIWFRVNGGNWNNNASYDPAAGTGGFDFSGLNAGPWKAMCNLYNKDATADNMTANFGGSAYAYAAPSGFGNFS